MQQFFGKLNIGFADLYVVGLIMCIGAAEVAHLAGLFLGLDMGMVSGIWGVFFAVLLFLCILIWCKFRKKGVKVESCNPVFPLVFILLLLVQMLYVFCMQQVSTPGDITLETVTTFLCEDGIHRVNPLTGGAYVNPLSMRYKILCLPTLYASVCRLTGILPETVVYHLVPLFILGGCYFAYYKLSELLYQKHMGKRYTFLILMVLLFFVMDGAPYLDGYAMMQAGYLGTSIRGLVLIPWTLVSSLNKNWWYCGLCVLAELCVCQTLFGAGFCLLITCAVVTIHLCEEKNFSKRQKKRAGKVVS